MAKQKFKLIQVYHNSWHLTDGKKTVAHIEGVEKLHPETRAPITKGFFKKKPVYVYVVTNLPGASSEKFLTLHAAAHHAADHFTSGGHIKDKHPVVKIERRIANLQREIWAAASDPRMNDKHQHGLLQISKSHAQTSKTFKQHFEDKD